MVFVYKKGGDWVRDGANYTVEFVGLKESELMLADGWHLSLDEALLADVEHESDQADQDDQADQIDQVDPEQESVADTNGDGKLSIDEARAYLDSVGVGYEDGLHWKKVVALAEQHMKGG